MRIHKKIGTKERLFEMFENVNKIKLTEATVKKLVKDLKAGDILTPFNTKIISASAGLNTQSGKIDVTVEYSNGKKTTKQWNKNTQVSVKTNESVNQNVNKIKLTEGFENTMSVKDWNEFSDGSVNIIFSDGRTEEFNYYDEEDPNGVLDYHVSAQEGDDVGYLSYINSNGNLIAAFEAITGTHNPDNPEWELDKLISVEPLNNTNEAVEVSQSNIQNGASIPIAQMNDTNFPQGQRMPSVDTADASIEVSPSKWKALFTQKWGEEGSLVYDGNFWNVVDNDKFVQWQEGSKANKSSWLNKEREQGRTTEDVDLVKNKPVYGLKDMPLVNKNDVPKKDEFGLDYQQHINQPPETHTNGIRNIDKRKEKSGSDYIPSNKTNRLKEDESENVAQEIFDELDMRYSHTTKTFSYDEINDVAEMYGAQFEDVAGVAAEVIQKNQEEGYQNITDDVEDFISRLQDKRVDVLKVSPVSAWEKFEQEYEAHSEFNEFKAIWDKFTKDPSQMKMFGESDNPEVGSIKYKYDQKGNWIPVGHEDKKIGIRPLEQPLGSNNWKVALVTLDQNGDLNDIVKTVDSWDEAKNALHASIT